MCIDSTTAITLSETGLFDDSPGCVRAAATLGAGIADAAGELRLGASLGRAVSYASAGCIAAAMGPDLLNSVSRAALKS